MKKLLLVLLFPFLSQSQIVNIPDANFKQAILMNGVDTNNDQEIQVSEAAAATYLDVNYSYITDLTGLEAFTSLVHFDCHNNQIASMAPLVATTVEYLYFNNNQVSSFQAWLFPNLKGLHCGYNYLTTLTIASLPNLEIIECWNNQLTTLDLYDLPSIDKLWCDNNQLTSLYVSGLPSLTDLSFGYNPITALEFSLPNNLIHLRTAGCPLGTLDLTPFPNLIDLKCYSCGLTSLDLSPVPNLSVLQCGDNNFTSIDFSPLTQLHFLECNVTPLTSIDVSMLTQLMTLKVGYNQLTTLDVSALTSLTTLDCHHNNLSTLFMKNGANETVLLSENPNLAYICADDSQVAYVQTQLNSASLNNTVCNSYCSITPGGNYNTIAGQVHFDADGNGCDASDFAFPVVKFKINDGTADLGSSATNSSGIFTFYTPLLQNSIIPDIENPAWFDFSPAMANVTFPDANNNSAAADFCISPNGVHHDVEVVIVPHGATRPGFDTGFSLIYKNKGNQLASGSIDFSFDESVLEFLYAGVLPTSITTGNLSWNYTGLMPFESRSIDVTFNANSPVETPALNIGDVLNFSAVINPLGGDELPLDNAFSISQTVVGSFDPNEKQCLEGETAPPLQIGDYLHYVINFENTGNFAAENVVIKDMIDAGKFDVGSLQVLGASHAELPVVTGNKVEFYFQGINLEPNAYGYVAYKIKTKPDLPIGATVTNKANIYFDFNLPVETNTASTTFQNLGAGNVSAISVKLYPNPAHQSVSVSSPSVIRSVTLYDLQGRIVLKKLFDTTEVSINVADLSNGVYAIETVTDSGRKVEKLIKR